MFRRKLLALDYVNPDILKDTNDESRIRALVIWLEDQRIRWYQIEDRADLRNINSPKWKEAFKKYLKDVECPVQDTPLIEQIEWLIGFAIKLEYSDNVSKYVDQTAENIQKTLSNVPKMVSKNPLDDMDFDCEGFKKGVYALAQLMNVNAHPDHLITLEAVSKVIGERLNQDAIQHPELVVPQGKPFPVLEQDLGFDVGDKVSNEAAKILTLLYIHDLRTLQTLINECIVAVQKVTANPKTDTKLGKVGF